MLIFISERSLRFVSSLLSLGIEREGRGASSCQGKLSQMKREGLIFSILYCLGYIYKKDITIMYTMCPPGYYHNGFMATPERKILIFFFTFTDYGTDLHGIGVLNRLVK